LIIKPIKEEFELFKELKKLNISVPILQVIKEVLELNKKVKELCISKGGQRKKDYLNTIQVDGKVADLLSGKLLKYRDPRTPIIIVYIGAIKV